MKVKVTKEKDVYINWFNVAPGVWGMKDMFVNIFMIHNPIENHWILVDAGLKWSASKIKKMAEHLFWPDVRPKSILLTHGHFDHVGSLIKLADEWEVPVYAHRLERPYLTGKSAYPPADPTVGGGMMATLSFLYPRGPINIEEKLRELPENGSIPGLPEWKYIHTPGHTAGHISLYRERDRVLLSGDAFVSLKAESTIAIMTQKKEVNGPPKYFTSDWNQSEESVRKLAQLEPEIIATGHGLPMRGGEMRKSLHNLVENFRDVAKPSKGRYVDEPAVTDENGVQYIPPHNNNSLAYAVFGITLVAVLGIFFYKRNNKQPQNILKQYTRTGQKQVQKQVKRLQTAF